MTTIQLFFMHNCILILVHIFMNHPEKDLEYIVLVKYFSTFSYRISSSNSSIYIENSNTGNIPAFPTDTSYPEASGTLYSTATILKKSSQDNSQII